MKKIIRLTERDLTRIVKRVISEQNDSSPNFPRSFGKFKKYADQYNDDTFIKYTYTYPLKSTARAMHNPSVYIQTRDGGKIWYVRWSNGSDSVSGSKTVIGIGKNKFPAGKYDNSGLSKAMEKFNGWASNYEYK